MLTLFLLCLATVNIAGGQYGDAQRQLDESLKIASTSHFLEYITDCLIVSASLAVAQKQYGRAVRLLGACEKHREDTGTPLHPKNRLEYERNVTEARAFLGEKPFAALWAEGRGISPTQDGRRTNDSVMAVPPCQFFSSLV